MDGKFQQALYFFEISIIIEYMDLFDLQNNEEKLAPLAERMRPRTIDEFIGQSKVVGKGSLLRRAISAGRLGSCIFYGPPGTGKTT